MLSGDEVGTLKIRLEFDSKSISEGTASAGGKVSAVGNKLSKGWAVSMGVISGITQQVFSKVTSVVSNSMDSAIKRFDIMNNFPKVMESLGFSADEAKASVGAMSDRLDGLPTSLQDMTGQVQQLSATMGNLNSGTVNATNVGLAFNDMMLAGGQGTQAASNAFTQYNQMLAAGKVDQQAWNSLVSAAPGQMNQLAQSVLGAGKGQRDLYEAMKNGTVTFDDLNAAIVKLDTEGGKGFESFNDQAKAATGGIGTQLENLQNTVTKVVAGMFNGEDVSGYLDQLVQRFNDVVPKLVTAAIGAVSAIISAVPKMLPGLSKAIVDAVPTVVKAVSDLVKGIAAALPSLIDDLMKGATELFNALAAELPTLIPELIQSLMDALLALTNPENLTQLVQAGINMLKALVKGIVDSLPILVQNLPKIVRNIVDVLIDNLPLLIEAGIEILLALIQGMTMMISELPGLVVDIIVEIVSSIIEHLPDILEAGVKILVELITGIQSVWSDFQTKTQEIPNTVIQKVKDALPKLLQKGKEMLGRLVEGIKGVWNKITSVASDIFHAVIDKVAEMPGNLFNKGKEMLTKLVNGVKGVWNKLTKAAADIFKAVVDTVKKIPGEMLNIGKNIVEGLWNGINGAVGWIKDKVTGFAGGVLDSIKSAFGINSPSTVFRDIVGKNLAYGIGVGFDDAMESVANDMASTALDSLGVSPQVAVSANWTGDLAGMFGEYEGKVTLGSGVNIEKQVFNINNELDADDMGRRMMQSIRRAV